ncbi:MAG: hypothetical protein M1822_004075 [Bathelium mastoideum]|nr:MAG: hypothetical protein M1822_004075 [Bathelium mastoideum]
MNGAPLWQTAQAPDGRTYYYNTQTKETQWTKPDALMSQTERARKNSPWTEYTAEGGRKYWHNKQSNQTTWEMPQELKDLEQQTRPSLPPQRPSLPQQTFVAGGTSNFSRPQFSPQQFASPHERNEPWNHHDRSGPDRPTGYGSMDGIRAAAIPGQEDVNYGTFEEAEAAFFKLLKRSGVQQDWAYEDMIKACVRDPQYRAIKDPKDRKLAFEKYMVEQRAQEKEREKERVAKLRTDFGVMLRRHPEIKYYSRWKTVRPIIENETIFRSTDNEDERRSLFEEYVAELRRHHDEQETALRKAAMDELTQIHKSLNLEPYTRWSEAQELLESNENYKDDPKFQKIHKSQVLTAFEDHIKTLERDFNDKRQKEKSLKFRHERQNRDAFKSLLRDLKANGQIKAGAKWMDIFPLIENDHRFADMLGQTGSTPLDFFWDMVEEEEGFLRTKRNDVLDALDDEHFEITPQTSLDSFLAVVRKDHRTANLDPDAVQLIFEREKEKASKHAEEKSHHAEKRQRRAIDDLRSRIKHLADPPVSLTDTWERVRPRVEATSEFKALETDDLRKLAFDKFHRRLRDKAADDAGAGDRDRDHRRSRHDSRNGTTHRDRDRDRADRSTRHRTRSPATAAAAEPDAYEADRRKAIADRERQYRKGSDRERDRDRDRVSDRLSASGGGGLSPPPTSASARSPHLRGSERDWRERRSGGGDAYEGGGRRGGAWEREGSGYAGGGRGDPRAKSRALDYGEGAGGAEDGAGTRRRRSEGSEGSEGAWVHKRARRDYNSRERTFSPPRRYKSRTPDKSVEPPREDPALQSGSEEGEIEEIEPTSAK